jgi:hypothetical protein
MKTRVVAWWSGGVASALACYIALQVYKNVVIVFQDTMNEDPDTYRFLFDCEDLYSQPIERISRIGKDFKHIEDVWLKYLSLNTAHGAICSTVLKREVREAYQNLDTDHAQIFGYDSSEWNRHFQMRQNYPEINCVSLLIENKIGKLECVKFFQDRGIEIPEAYKLGYRNNNCLETGCVRAGIGYWQKYQIDFPDRFDRMAAREHLYTDLKGEPVTILKDQSKKNGAGFKPVFLKPHPKYPLVKDLSMMKGRRVEALVECNGFCGTKLIKS